MAELFSDKTRFGDVVSVAVVRLEGIGRVVEWKLEPLKPDSWNQSPGSLRLQGVRSAPHNFFHDAVK